MIDLKKQTKIILLYDSYGNLLKDKEKEIFSQYYEENFSQTEIAENLKISKQAVSQRLEKVKNKLILYDEKLGEKDGI